MLFCYYFRVNSVIIDIFIVVFKASRKYPVRFFKIISITATRNANV